MKINTANTAKSLSPTVQDPIAQEWVATALHLMQLTAALVRQWQQPAVPPPPSCSPGRAKLKLQHRGSDEALSVGRTQLFDLLRRGEIASVKIGRRRLILAESLDVYLDRLIAEQAGA